MNKKIYMACAGALSLAMFACSDNSPVSGSSEDPNVITAKNDSSSSEKIESSSSKETDPSSSSETPVVSSSSEMPIESSSSEPLVSSSSVHHMPCKTQGGGGCAPAPSGDLWAPDEYHWDIVNTRKYAEGVWTEEQLSGKEAGRWFWFTDAVEGGKTVIDWPEEPENGYRDSTLEPIVEAYGGIWGTVLFDKGEVDGLPYAVLGFNIAGLDSAGNRMTADISNWDGFCLQYESTMTIAVKLDLGDSLNAELDDDLPLRVFPKQPTVGGKCYSWSEFKQSGWSEKTISMEEAVKNVAGIWIEFEGRNDIEGAFRIYAVGSNLDDYY